MFLKTKAISGVKWVVHTLNSAYRVMKPGGYILYTVPLFWHFHEKPPGFYRYTRYGLEYLFHEVNFWIEQLEALRSFGTTFPSELNSFHRRFGRAHLTPFIDFAVVINNVISSPLDRGLLRHERFTVMNRAVPKKPDVA